IVRGQLLQLGAASDDVMNMQTAFAKYGYGIPVSGKYDTATLAVVAAFQRHFRPVKVDGVFDHSTMETLHALLSSLPGDAVNMATK
ncbi:N-acetylmuramoyl-L-alanine amidase, partial [Staphylococcus aureus]|uniref:peptidoglycan-binding domain-containing protein n=1 Tax=Staphylococcus aureus TaxID=1280 RepID=UPI000F6AEF6B